MKKSILFLLVLCSFSSYAQHQNFNKDEIWNKISQYFKPPAEFQGKFGAYRSPLVFNNGKEVKTAKDWEKRKQEISDKWTSVLGKWPPFIKNQQVEFLEATVEEEFTIYKIRYNWTPNEKTIAYLSVPKGKGKFPAVITTFYEPETAIGKSQKVYRDFALQLTKRGFVTLSIGTTEASKARIYSIYYPSIENATVQPLSMLAYAAANSWYVLANLPYVDDKRIGITGHSFGGKWSMFASCLFDKFACAAWTDPGIVFDNTKGSGVNYWEPWYLGYYPPPWTNTWNKTGEGAKGIYPKLLKDGSDLHELHALMAPRPFLVSGGSSDPIERWIPLNHTIKLNDLLGFKNRVAMQNRPLHSPNEYSNSVIYSFFEYFLK